MDCSTPGFPVLHCQTHIHWVSDAIQPSHPLSSPFSSCFQSLLLLRSFSMSQLFASGGQSIEASASHRQMTTREFNNSKFFLFCFCFNGIVVYLQSCINFCCIAKWFSYIYICVHVCVHARSVTQSCPTLCNPMDCVACRPSVSMRFL